MNSRIINLVFALGVLALFQGCASGTTTTTENTLDQKVAAEQKVGTTKDLRSETNQILENTKGLTEDQRVKLSALRDKTNIAVDTNREESRRLRAVLVKDLVSPNYSAKEVRLIKKKLADLENSHIQIIFDAVDQANVILGRDALKNQEVVDSFFERHNHLD